MSREKGLPPSIKDHLTPLAPHLQVNSYRDPDHLHLPASPYHKAAIMNLYAQVFLDLRLSVLMNHFSSAIFAVLYATNVSVCVYMSYLVRMEVSSKTLSDCLLHVDVYKS